MKERGRDYLMARRTDKISMEKKKSTKTKASWMTGKKNKTLLQRIKVLG